MLWYKFYIPLVKIRLYLLQLFFIFQFPYLTIWHHVSIQIHTLLVKILHVLYEVRLLNASKSNLMIFLFYKWYNALIQSNISVVKILFWSFNFYIRITWCFDIIQYTTSKHTITFIILSFFSFYLLISHE